MAFTQAQLKIMAQAMSQMWNHNMVKKEQTPIFEEAGKELREQIKILKELDGEYD